MLAHAGLSGPQVGTKWTPSWPPAGLGTTSWAVLGVKLAILGAALAPVPKRQDGKTNPKVLQIRQKRKRLRTPTPQN